MWVFIVTLFFMTGAQNVERYEFKEAAHARDLCRAKEVSVLAEVQQQANRGLLKGYTLVACHQE